MEKRFLDYSKDVCSNFSVSNNLVLIVFQAGTNHQYPHQEPDTEGHVPNDYASSDSAVLLYRRRVQNALEALKLQHAHLAQSMQTLSTTLQPSIQGSPMPDAVQDIPAHLPTSFSRVGRRNSTSTVSSIHEWFDAMDGLGDGAQEFVMDIPNTVEEREEERKGTGIGSPSSVDHDESDSDSSEDAETVARALNTEHGRQRSTALDVIRRTQLPVGPASDEGSLFAILKKNVGKVRR
jgi:hypothetical protein